MRRNRWFWVIFALGIGLRLYGITNPLLDNHAWRQVDTASMAANFLQYGFWPLLPQLNYDGPPPNFAELEFPLPALLTTGLWSLFGQHDIIARGVAVVFSAATLWLIYLTGKLLFDRNSGLLAMAFFAVNPLAIYYGRTVMPESSMIFFMTAAIYLTLLWHQSGQRWALWLGAAALALAGLAKLPGLMIVAPIGVILLKRYGWKAFVRWQVWLFLLIGLGLPFVYYALAHLYTSTRFLSGIVNGQMTTQYFAWDYLRERLGAMVTGYLLITGLAALCLRRTRAGNLFIFTWLGVLLLYTIVFGARIQLEYYLLPLIPPLSILAGGAIGKFWGDPPGVLAGMLILAMTLSGAVAKLAPYYAVDNAVLVQAAKIKQATSPGSLLVLSDVQPMVFYYSDRKGWRLAGAAQSPENLEKLRRQGAALFVILPGSQLNPQLKGYLDEHYPFNQNGGFYDLRKVR
ncbi:MAG TPA: glycosyltransferase family 39 protein [Desulfobacteria bacterium]|nr:glycosyltransferase family 39 protein [Desulfobacteria bacterium]